MVLYGSVQVFWDVLAYTENTAVTANRVDGRMIDKEKKCILVIEMSCPWVDNRLIKDTEKTANYGPLRWELKQQYPGSVVKQYNVTIDFLV